MHDNIFIQTYNLQAYGMIVRKFIKKKSTKTLFKIKIVVFHTLNGVVYLKSQITMVVIFQSV